MGFMGEMTSVARVHVIEGRPWKDALISVVEPRSPYRPWHAADGIEPGDAVIAVLDTDPRSVLAGVGIVGPGRGCRSRHRRDRPLSDAVAASSDLVAMPSLVKMWWTWLFTVLVSMSIRSAICGLVRPWVTRATMSCSVGVRLFQPWVGRRRSPRIRWA